MTKLSAQIRASITRAPASDGDALLEFHRRMFGSDSYLVDQTQRNWLERNPCPSPDGSVAFVCRQDGEIVGSQGDRPFDLAIAAETHRAIWAVDLIVDPAWRIRGVGPALVDAQLEFNDIVGAIGISDEAYKLYLRKGWSDLGIVPFYIRPVDVGKITTVVPARRGSSFGRLTATAVRITDSAYHRFTRLRGFSFVAVDSIDSRVDDVWNVARREHAVIGRRDAEALHWGIDDRPDASELKRFYLVRHGHVLGYVVLRTATWLGEPAVRIVDYLAPRQWLGALLSETVHQARELGAIAVLAHTLNGSGAGTFRRLGFLRRDQAFPIRFMAWCRKDAALEPIRDAKNWFVTLTDSDLEQGVTALASGRGLP